MDREGRWKYLSEWLRSIGKGAWFTSTFNCDYGKNIFLGANITMTFYITILDIRKVINRGNTMIGPGTLITSVGHSFYPKRRRGHQAFTKP